MAKKMQSMEKESFWRDAIGRQVEFRWGRYFARRCSGKRHYILGDGSLTRRGRLTLQRNCDRRVAWSVSARCRSRSGDGWG